MAKARNIDSYIGFGKEASWGAPALPSYYVPLLSQNLNFNQPTTFSGAALGQRYTTNYVDEAVSPDVGGWNAEMWQDELAPLVAWAVGADSIGGASSPYIHTISRATTIPSLTIRKGVGTVQEYYVPGYKINTLTFNLNQTGMQTYTITGFGKKEVKVGSVATPSFTTQNTYGGTQVRYYIAAAGTARASVTTQYKVLSSTVVINNNIEAPAVPQGYTEIQDSPNEGELIYTVTLNFQYFDSVDTEGLYDAFKAGTRYAVRIIGDGTDPYQFDWYWPEVKFDPTSPNSAGRTGSVAPSFTGRAIYNTTQTTDGQLLFQDTISAAYV